MNPLIHPLFRDSRVQDAIELLQKTLGDYQQDIQFPGTVTANTAVQYKQALEHMGTLRGGPLFFPYLSSGVGKGALVQLADGSVKYDFITGIGVHYAGHSHPKILAAGVKAALGDTVMQGNLQQDLPSLQLIETLVDLARKNGSRIAHAFLTTSGAMANENALKMMFQKHAPASRLLAFAHCFAGRTMVMAQVTDKPANRQGLPPVLEVDYVPFYDHARPQQSIAESVKILQQHLNAHPGEYAGMIMELIQGEGGYYPGTTDFFTAIIDVLKAQGLAVMVDEIQTFGRTQEPFAFQAFGLDKVVDLVTVGKMTQICATLFTADYRPQPGLISQTFTASSSAIWAAQTILDELRVGGFWGPDGKIIQHTAYFRSGLERLSQKHPQWLQGPFGYGGMVAMTVGDGQPDTAKRFIQLLFEEGVLSFVAGRDPTRVRFLLPLAVVTVADMDQVLQLLEKALSRLAAEKESESA